MHEKYLHYYESAWSRLFTALISKSFKSFGKKSRIYSPFHFKNLCGVAVGEEVTIAHYAWLMTTGCPPGSSAIISIGNNVLIGMNATISGSTKIIIHVHVLMGRNVYISDHGHEFKDISRPVMDQGIGKTAPVIIGAGTWLGNNSAVLPGVTIGKNCVVGTNAVVTHDVPDFCLVAGIPAAVIKRFDSKTATWLRIA